MIKNTRKCWIEGKLFKCGKFDGDAEETQGCLIDPIHEEDCLCSEYRLGRINLFQIFYII